MIPPKLAVIEESPAETIARLRRQLQEVERVRDLAIEGRAKSAAEAAEANRKLAKLLQPVACTCSPGHPAAGDNVCWFCMRDQRDAADHEIAMLRDLIAELKTEAEHWQAGRDEALREATALHQSLVNATATLAAVRADVTRYAARAIEARAVAACLLAEWTDPANWSEAITAAEAKFWDVGLVTGDGGVGMGEEIRKQSVALAELLTLADIATLVDDLTYEGEPDACNGNWCPYRIGATLQAFAAGRHPSQEAGGYRMLGVEAVPKPVPAALSAEVTALRQQLRALQERVDVMNAQVLHLARYTSGGNGVAKDEATT